MLQFFSRWPSQGRFDKLDAIIRDDPEVFSAVQAAAMLTASYLRGFGLKWGETLEPDEAVILTELQDLWRRISWLAYDAAFKVILYGDACYLITTVEGEGLTDIRWLPNHVLTAIEKDPQPFEELIERPKWYVLNEGIPDLERRFPAEDVLHFNWDRVELVQDLLGRKTLGVWNRSPVESAIVYVLWKRHIILTDIRWRSVAAPIQHHKLPSDAFDPEMFPGTVEEKVQKAQEAAKKAIEEYKQALSPDRPDRVIITLDNVEIDVVEPRSHFTDPNPLLDQLNEAIFSCIGVPRSAVRGVGRGSYASEVIASTFFFLKYRYLAERIAARLVKLAQRHLLAKYGQSVSHLLPKIFVHIQDEMFMRCLLYTSPSPRDRG